MQYRNYTDEDVIKKSAEAKSMGQLLGLLGLRKAGGNYAHLKKTLQRLNLTCDHWEGAYGQGWSRGQQLKDWSSYSRISHLKKHLLKEVKGCEECLLNEWMQKPIVLEVHHKDADRTNNSRNNLQVLCPNCHSQTKNFRGKKCASGETEEHESFKNFSVKSGVGASPT